MPITSIGYAGQVTEANTADWLAAVAEYGVVGAADWRVSAVPLADRTVQVAGGAGWGKAITDTSTETVNLTLDPVTSGSTRWDLITAHRDKAGTSGLTTFGVVEGNADPLSAIAARARFGPSSDADDQPLALARVDAGSTDIKELRDLRCWSANGGMCAIDQAVLQYLTRPGTRVQIGSVTWSRMVNAQGNAVWTSDAPPARRRWTADRSARVAAGAASDMYGLTWAGLAAVVIPDAPAGEYQAAFQYVGGPSSPGSMVHDFQVTGPSAGRVIPSHFDGLVTETRTGTVPFTHAGGTAQFQLLAKSGTEGHLAWVHNAYTFLDVYWLGR